MRPLPRGLSTHRLKTAVLDEEGLQLFEWDGVPSDSSAQVSWEDTEVLKEKGLAGSRSARDDDLWGYLVSDSCLCFLSNMSYTAPQPPALRAYTL